MKTISHGLYKSIFDIVTNQLSPTLTIIKFPGPKSNDDLDVDVVGDHRQDSKSPDIDQQSITPEPTPSPTPNQVSSLLRVTEKQTGGYKLSSNGFRGGEGEPVSVLLNSATFPASLPSSKPNHLIQTSGPYRTPSKTIAVQCPTSKAAQFACRSPEAQPKPLTPPVTPVAGTPPLPTNEHSVKKEKITRSFSIADILAPDNKPYRPVGETKPTLQLQTSPKSECLVSGSITTSTVGDQQRSPVEHRRPNHLQLKTREPYTDAVQPLMKRARLEDFRVERPELQMQFEQTNRNINYLKSFLLAQRLNSL